jgi:hypothetical protein
VVVHVTSCPTLAKVGLSFPFTVGLQVTSLQFCVIIGDPPTQPEGDDPVTDLDCVPPEHVPQSP